MTDTKTVYAALCEACGDDNGPSMVSPKADERVSFATLSAESHLQSDGRHTSVEVREAEVEADRRCADVPTEAFTS